MTLQSVFFFITTQRKWFTLVNICHPITALWYFAAVWWRCQQQHTVAHKCGSDRVCVLPNKITPLNKHSGSLGFTLTFTPLSRKQASNTHTHTSMPHLVPRCANTSACAGQHGNAWWNFHDASFIRCQAWCQAWCHPWWYPLAWQLRLDSQQDRYLSSTLFLVVPQLHTSFFFF